ncbi:nucleotidyltransferase [Solibacillus sp. A46]|uniref:tRNA(Met) cytidine acetate ligase n=1 Tax=Solibacillus faecavium TaxID=2762221 RepID=A0ABR8XUD9_9BACL|nr:nucleotidyltransferase [Solibacillus faecavium]MBD8035545.1 nucleotidyltransferase [Solibacillus faecavium]
MQAVGIIVEYNPFHNGHLHHVKEAKRTTNSDVAVAVMSGHFLQRGEPALVDKWHRTKMALASGVDVVIELPYIFSTAQATGFASGAVQLLEAMQCTTLAFGSEQGTIEPFLNTYHLIENNRARYNEIIKENIQLGKSYPQALFIAYEQLKQLSPNAYIDLGKPNNILGFHYVEAIKQLNCSMQPATVQRIIAGYHDAIDTNHEIASATGIRQALFSGQSLQEVTKYLPSASMEQLQIWQKEHQNFASWESFWPLMKYAILRHTPQQLKQYADVSEGLENSLIKYAASSSNYMDFMNALKSKRYTWTRLQRMLLHIYTGITKEQLHAFSSPSYIRILGMTTKGQQYISSIKKSVTLPLISRVAAITDPILSIDIRATQMYQLGIQQFSNKKIDEDYKTPPIRL